MYTLICESSSAGRASRCQREGREFESRLSLTIGPKHWGLLHKFQKSLTDYINV